MAFLFRSSRFFLLLAFTPLHSPSASSICLIKHLFRHDVDYAWARNNSELSAYINQTWSEWLHLKHTTLWGRMFYSVIGAR